MKRALSITRLLAARYGEIFLKAMLGVAVFGIFIQLTSWRLPRFSDVMEFIIGGASAVLQVVVLVAAFSTYTYFKFAIQAGISRTTYWKGKAFFLLCLTVIQLLFGYLLLLTPYSPVSFNGSEMFLSMVTRHGGLIVIYFTLLRVAFGFSSLMLYSAISAVACRFSRATQVKFVVVIFALLIFLGSGLVKVGGMVNLVGPLRAIRSTALTLHGFSAVAFMANGKVELAHGLTLLVPLLYATVSVLVTAFLAKKAFMGLRLRGE